MPAPAPVLSDLFQAIAAGDRAATRRLLRAVPALAVRAVAAGGSEPERFYPRIGHYAYAGDTPLHLAAAAQDGEVVRELLGAGAAPRARNRRGAEPLHYAADGAPGADAWNPAGQAAVVGLLLAAGADPNARDKSGVTPLHRAVRTRSATAVRALLGGGADVRIRNRSGSTPLHLAVHSTGRGGSGEPPARAEQAEIVRLLVAAGARASDRNAAGRSVRSYAEPWIGPLLGRD